MIGSRRILLKVHQKRISSKMFIFDCCSLIDYLKDVSKLSPMMILQQQECSEHSSVANQSKKRL
jgi:hypothetical protein